MLVAVLQLMYIKCMLCMLCGFSVFEMNVNNPGRGVNVAVVNVDTMQIAKAVRFDTYQSLDG